ncbi:MAG: helix-turn-helix domain-containing protein [Alicyclobacillus macrosporangiidus]|uniref:helix-turn-helix domain-containing protein n=1 Tax=Alicyclobacillus macrosporangiidus TaxID=392015 RepID=UPI0026EFFC9C|nr:helix-turn-helix domain-containing protein [Alicyclobacillus macrosporangiidus]MCL6600029.1 helix-turn-helix domain-containing protein [Alicyclobacillus macrosporangiidus]
MIFHPIRMRIIQCLARSTEMTAAQLAEALPDVPQASLYRHLTKLHKGGLLSVVAERQVRGARERVYALASPGAGYLGGEEARTMSREEHMRCFTTFLAKLLSDFERYIAQPDVDLERDGVGYRQFELCLSDAEFQALARELSQTVQRYAGRDRTLDRKLRVFTTIVVPEADQTATAD